MELRQLKALLPHGAVREISKRTKISECTISNVLSGKRKSPKERIIINAIADYLIEHKKAEQIAREKLDAILNE